MQYSREHDAAKLSKAETKSPASEKDKATKSAQRWHRPSPDKDTLGTARSADSSKRRSTIRLARALFIIYLVFSACWLPFSLLIVLDAQDTFSHQLHVTIVAWAHLHPSINWLVYYHTHSKFHAAFRRLLGMDTCCR